jgi:hypothetical protein
MVSEPLRHQRWLAHGQLCFARVRRWKYRAGIYLRRTAHPVRARESLYVPRACSQVQALRATARSRNARTLPLDEPRTATRDRIGAIYAPFHKTKFTKRRYTNIQNSYQIQGMETPFLLCDDIPRGLSSSQSWRRRGGVVRFEKRGGRAGTRRFSSFLLTHPGTATSNEPPTVAST